jgi:hypothetical protein
MTSDPPSADLIAGAWNRFQTQVLPAVLEEPRPGAVDRAQLSFYFGAIALLGILGAASDGAESGEAVSVVRQTPDAKLSECVESREADLH